MKMGYVFTYKDAVAYEKLLQNPRDREAVDLENWLMCKMLRPRRLETVLDIGCGTGEGLLALRNAGVQVTGLDPSPYMLDIAGRKLGHRADLHQGFAEDLPFEDNAFTYSCMTNTLEFADDPQKALEEMFRVTRTRVFIGIINRHSSRAACLRLQQVFTRDIYRHARFFTVWELKKMIRTIAGNVPLCWQTAYQIPRIISRPFHRIRPLRYKDPLGEFIGITVALVPRFTTRQLRLKCRVYPFPVTMTGMTSEWRPDEGSVCLRKTGG